MIEDIRYRGKKIEIDQAGDTVILHELIFYQLNPAIGDEIDLSKAVFDSQIEFAFEQAANYVVSRLKSSQQVKLYLQKKGFSKEVAQVALDRLIDNRLIDDQEYARIYIESFSGERGHRYLKQKLRERGITDYNLPQEDPEVVCAILEKRWGNSGKMELKQRQKAQNFLLGRGFSFETIKKALEMYENKSNDD